MGPVGTSVVILGLHDAATVDQLQRCLEAEEGSLGVLCADGHKGYSMPIGGVVAYRNHVSPSGVGYDIGCGNLAVRTPLKVADVRADLPRIADTIQERISFGVGRKNNEPIADHLIFDEIRSSPVAQQRSMLQLAQQQLGTVGSGNHYVILVEDQEGFLWVACHFGSRGFGHKTAKGFMNLAQGREWENGAGDGEMDAPPLLFNVDTPSGLDYLEAMSIAGHYAQAGRVEVVEKVLGILGTGKVMTIHNHHNFTWSEKHNGEYFLVVRKGSTPAFPHQLGFIGGSMGDISVIVQGKESPESAQLLYSTVHGAGRVMSRTTARGKIKKGIVVRPGLVDFEAERAKLTERGIILRGAGADEAPPVYRSLQSVLDAHAGTIDILYTLQPLVTVMAGKDEHDPYKD